MSNTILETKVLELLKKSEYAGITLKLSTSNAGITNFLFEKAESADDEILNRLKIDIDFISFVLDEAVGSVEFIGETFNPARIRLQTLNLLRQIAPANLEKIVEELERVRSEAVPEKSVKAALDAVRKQGLVHWSKSQKKYFLTKSGLNLLGSGIGADSPDVVRILALARGKV